MIHSFILFLFTIQFYFLFLFCVTDDNETQYVHTSLHNYLPWIDLPVHLPTFTSPTVCRFSLYLILSLSFSLSFFFSLSLSLSLSLCLPHSLFLSLSLSVFLSLSLYLSICISICLSIYLTFFLSIPLAFIPSSPQSSSLCLTATTLLSSALLFPSPVKLLRPEAVCRVNGSNYQGPTRDSAV